MKYLTQGQTKRLIGKKITAVTLEQAIGGSGPYHHLQAIELEDGTRLRLMVIEGEADYGVQGLVFAPRRKKGKVRDAPLALEKT